MFGLVVVAHEKLFPVRLEAFAAPSRLYVQGVQEALVIASAVVGMEGESCWYGCLMMEKVKRAANLAGQAVVENHCYCVEA